MEKKESGPNETVITELRTGDEVVEEGLFGNEEAIEYFSKGKSYLYRAKVLAEILRFLKIITIVSKKLFLDGDFDSYYFFCH